MDDTRVAAVGVACAGPGVGFDIGTATTDAGVELAAFVCAGVSEVRPGADAVGATGDTGLDVFEPFLDTLSLFQSPPRPFSSFASSLRAAPRPPFFGTGAGAGMSSGAGGAGCLTGDGGVDFAASLRPRVLPNLKKPPLDAGVEVLVEEAVVDEAGDGSTLETGTPSSVVEMVRGA